MDRSAPVRCNDVESLIFIYRERLRMRAVKKARKLIVEDPSSASAKILSGLILSLETNADFSIGDIYQLDFDTFKLAIAVLKDWRLDRYYSCKVKLYDASLEASSKFSC